jgi:hypothetical protein
MWFKAFVLLRIPVSVGCLLGYATATLIWDMGLFGCVFVAGLCFFLELVSTRLARRHKSALKLAGWLLALELVGAVLLLAGGHYVITRAFNQVSAVWVACGVLVFWTLPNAMILHSQRARFTEPAKEKPGG